MNLPPGQTAGDVYADLQARMPRVMAKARQMLACGHSPLWIVNRLNEQSGRIRQDGLECYRIALDYLVQRIVDGEEVCDN